MATGQEDTTGARATLDRVECAARFMSQQFRYDAFISYRRADGTPVAKALRQRLRRFQFPKELSRFGKEPIEIYLDTVYERADEDFFENTIKAALRDSAHLIVVQTPSISQPRAEGQENWV